VSTEKGRSSTKKATLNRRNILLGGTTAAAASTLGAGALRMAQAQAQAQPGLSRKPNILFIMGDDIGWFNIGAYHRGMMSGKTPNLDKLASQGMLFTDYYAEASCTAGRAAFITGEIPLRTGLTTVVKLAPMLACRHRRARLQLRSKRKAMPRDNLARIISAI